MHKFMRARSRTRTVGALVCAVLLVAGVASAGVYAASSIATTRPLSTAAASSVVNPAPTGPAGSWKPVYADGFGVPIGTAAGQDPTWKIKVNSKGCCGNSNETSTEVASSVHWSEGNGLELRCEALACSGVSTNGFTYALGHGATFAFETVAKLPDNSTGGDDSAFWSISTTRWPPELDFFEQFGWGSCESNPATCHGGFPVYKSNGLGSHELYVDMATILGEEPWLKFHRYTFSVEGSTFTLYVDGKRIGGFSQAVNTDAMNLILVHALRVSTKPRNTSFDVRSVAVYEDAAHAGQFVVNGGIAPGTTIGGESSPEPTPTTTETTPTSPPPAVPATPAGLAVVAHREGTSSWFTITANTVAGATSYPLYRTEATAKSSTAKPGELWTTGSLPSYTNHIGVKQGERYCFWITAKNASGESKPSAPACTIA